MFFAIFYLTHRVEASTGDPTASMCERSIPLAVCVLPETETVMRYAAFREGTVLAPSPEAGAWSLIPKRRPLDLLATVSAEPPLEHRGQFL